MKLDTTDITLPRFWHLVYLIIQIYLGHRLKSSSFITQT